MESTLGLPPVVPAIPSGAELESARTRKRIRGDDWLRFWCKVDIRGEDECWPWRERTDDGGYGRFSVKAENGKFTEMPAHRWLLGKLRGRPLTGGARGLEDGCHSCSNPPCCNPAHLYVDTRSGNVKYSVAGDRHVQSRKDECPAGHQYDEANTYIKPSGERCCRTCREDQRPVHEQARKDRKTCCKNKHLLAGDNLIICKGGRRKCAICETARIEKAIAGRKRQLAGASG